jgi:hypothetical protein
MRGASWIVWLGDGEANERAELRREPLRSERAPERRLHSRRPLLRGWLAALRARIAHAG